MNKLEQLHADVSVFCDQVAKLFKVRPLVTILIRNPHLEDGDMVVSDDEIDSMISALQNLKTKEIRKLK